MKLTTKTRYGTRAMLELALHQEEGPLSLGEIAARQELSEKYAEALVGRLRVAGLVSSVRGAQGGYLLARPPEAISLYDIYLVLEGAEPFVPCSAERDCERWDACVTQAVWQEMYDAAMSVLRNRTLADLARSYRRKQAAVAATYTI